MTNDSMIALLKQDITSINAYLKNVTNNYVKIGVILYGIKKHETIEKTRFNGYKNIVDFSLAEFGFEKTKTYNLISVYEKFFKNDINSDYKYYQFTNLVLMLNMTEEQIKKCDPQMTTRQIKEIKCNFSVRTESETIANTENVLKNNVIEGVFPDKKEIEKPEEKTNTIIISELPKPEKIENKTITIEVKSEQNNDFVTNDDYYTKGQYKDDFYFKEYTKAMDLKNKADIEIISLKDKLHVYYTMAEKQKQKDADMIEFIYSELYNINNPIQNEKIEILLNQIYSFKKSNVLPQKIKFMEKVI